MLSEKGRIYFLDELRGLAVIGMIIYHGAYDLYAIFGVDIPIFSLPLRLLQLFTCTTFIFISGVSCQLSHSNLKRGLLTFGVGLLITLATLLFDPHMAIWFGILHFLGLAMIIYSFIGKALEKLPPAFGFTLFILLFILLYGIDGGKVLFGAVNIPISFYQSLWGAPLGFPSPAFRSADYFPLLPWLLLFLSGTYIGRLIKRDNTPAFLMKKHIPFLAYMGQKALVIYIIHQPLTYGLLWIIFRLFSL